MMLKVENGSFAYKTRTKTDPEKAKILENINFEVSSGEILAILGPNGAGKTTLLRCIMNMLQWDSGTSTIDGEEIRRMPVRKLWRRMAYVPQAKSAATSFSAFQTVLLGRNSRIGSFSSPKAEDLAVAENVMKRLGIYDLADKPCHEMSGGEFQMVLIARALAAEPEILVLDEPESNLDFKNQLIVLDTISELAAEGMACIFNTHYPAHALQRADKALILPKREKIDNGDHVANVPSAEQHGMLSETASRCIYGRTASVVTEENIRKAFGVNAKIGSIETGENMIQNVIPLSVDGLKAESSEHEEPETAIASVTIIIKDNENSAKINKLLHEYSHLLIGRMGMPYRKQGLYIINVNLDGDRVDIEELTHRLTLIRGISIKTTYAKG